MSLQLLHSVLVIQRLMANFSELILFYQSDFADSQITVLFRSSLNRKNKVDEIIDIPEVMFNPARLRQRHFFDEMLKTLTHQSMQKVDSSISKGVS